MQLIRKQNIIDLLQAQGELRAAQEQVQRLTKEHDAESRELRHQLNITKELEES